MSEYAHDKSLGLVGDDGVKKRDLQFLVTVERQERTNVLLEELIQLMVEGPRFGIPDEDLNDFDPPSKGPFDDNDDDDDNPFHR